MPDLILSLSAELVSAHVAKNKVPAEDLPKLIREVHRALSNAVQAGRSAPKAEPAVPVNKSVRNDHLPGVRQVVVDAEAASVDRASSYSWRLPAEMGVAGVVPDRGARLRKCEVGHL